MLSKEPIYIETFSHDGRGIARISGKATFVFGAIPGEMVTIESISHKKHFDEARTLEILEASPLRIKPACPYYALCGGCSFQHVDVLSQLSIKEKLLLDILKRVGHTRPEAVMPSLQSDVWHYRHKARLSLEWDQNNVMILLGFKGRDTPGSVVDIEECLVLESRLNTCLSPLKKLLSALSFTRSLTHIDMAAGDKNIAVIIPFSLDKVLDKEREEICKFSKMMNCLCFFKGAANDTYILLSEKKQASCLSYTLVDNLLTYDFLPGDFTQIHPLMNQKMVTRLIDCLDIKKDDVILDLFCGIGNLSLPLSQYCAQVIGVEGHLAAVNRARSNAKKNRCDNVIFQVDNLNKRAVLAPYVKYNINTIVIDPPRTGALTVVREIALISPNKIAYISCNPATLARDARILIEEQGYILKSVGVMDMFPHTTHVESIALFEKG